MVLKEPDVVPYLRERVVEAATEIKATADRNSLLEEVAETHEDFLRRMRDMPARPSTWRTGSPAGKRQRGDELDTISAVLVDDDHEALAKLESALPAQKGWEFVRRSPGAKRSTS